MERNSGGNLYGNFYHVVVSSIDNSGWNYQTIPMTYKVEFEVDGDSVTYTVRAENVLEAEDEALKKLKKDIPKDHVTAGQYSVEHIVNIKEAW